MRRLLGFLVLILGVGLLGWYASGHQAKDIEARIAAEAAAVATGSVHGVETRVSGRDIVVRGLANDPQEHDSLLAALEATPGRRVVVDSLDVLETAAPFVFTSKLEAGVQTYAGNVPSEAVRDEIGQTIGAEMAQPLVLAAGVPDANWKDAVARGLAALAVLKEGALAISDRTVTVTGKALTPIEKAEAQAILGDLPDGYTAKADITPILQIASPFEFGSGKLDGRQDYWGVIPSEQARDLLVEKTGSPMTHLRLAAGVPDDAWIDAASLGLTALDTLDEGEMVLSDRLLTLTGVSATPIEKTQAEKLLAALPEGYVAVVDVVALLDIVTPFELKATKTEMGLEAVGVAPSEDARAALLAEVGEAAGAFRLAAGAPDGGWTAAAFIGIEALGPLNSGEMVLSDRSLTLTGEAETPKEQQAALAALADLPDGYVARTDITLLDDGTPPAFVIDYSATRGATVDGKLPRGASLTAIGQALGLDKVEGSPTVARVGDSSAAEALQARLAALADWLPDLESYRMTSDAGRMRLEAQVSPGVEAGAIQDALARSFGDGAVVAVATPSSQPEEGATRENVVSGKQVFQGGYWLPVPDATETSAKSCAAASEAALASARINFLSGSARLDPTSVRAINSIAGVVLNCVKNGGLKVEIGGHTDDTGDWQANLALSQERAQAVVDALIARGVPADRISARGYGESQPVAANDTDAGRAKNRRTTLSWTEFQE